MADTEPIADGSPTSAGPVREPSPGWSRLSSMIAALSRVFGADIRSLAALRIVLGIVVVIDVASRLSEIRIHYTDDGILPRDDAIVGINDWRWSLLFINGTESFTLAVFLAAIGAAIALIVGYRTRLASIVVWVLVVSIQARNPLVLSGADAYLRVLLFWSMFLPLASTWSLDRRQGRVAAPNGTWVASVATAAFLLQIAFVYLFTAILKSGDEWRTDFTAIWYALGAGQLTTPFGAWLHQFDGLLRVLTVTTLAVEVIAPIIIFSPWKTWLFRLIGIGLIAGLQIGIFLTMNIGIFPIVSITCMVAFMPTEAWSWLARTLRLPSLQPGRRLASARQVMAGWRGRILAPGARIGLVAGSGPSLEEATDPADPPAPDPDATAILPTPTPSRPALALATNVVAALLLLVVLGWNIASVSAYTMPDASRPVVYGLGLYQRWSMFAPRPPGSTRWTVLQGTLADGTEVNLLVPLVEDDMSLLVPLTWDRPANIGSDYYGSKEWRKYFEALNEDSGRSERRVLAGYLCRNWNRAHDGDHRLERVAFYSVLESTLPEGEVAEQRQIRRSTATCD